MGQVVDARQFSREDRQRYREKVRACLDVFATMLSESRFDSDRRYSAQKKKAIHMARNEKRIKVTLACEECKRRNYQTDKNRRNDPDRVELRKYCRWCGRHTPHKETR